MTVNVGAEIGRLKADERLEILPVVRSDKFTRLSFSTVFRQFTLGGFAPMMRIVRERNRSTVEFYDYKRTAPSSASAARFEWRRQSARFCVSASMPRLRPARRTCDVVVRPPGARPPTT